MTGGGCGRGRAPSCTQKGGFGRGGGGGGGGHCKPAPPMGSGAKPQPL